MYQASSFKGYVLKIASRCNLNCSYCYMYNLADQSWRDQPKRMSLDTVQRIADRIKDHSAKHGRSQVDIGLHGGEPLLVGQEHLASIVMVLRRELSRAGLKVRLTIQSNGLLFDESFGDFLRQQRVSIGVSIDGPPKINDLYRVDHKGRGSSGRLERPLHLLAQHYREVFAGLLCVVNIEADPAETFDYLASFDPPTINFLLPLDNHDRRPVGKENSLDCDVYGRWLSAVFDRWAVHDRRMRVLIFNSIINLLNGWQSLTEGHGLAQTQIAVIETNGAIELIDSLKSTHHSATSLGLNVFDDSLDDAVAYLNELAERTRLDSLPDECRHCRLVDVCGGGDPPTRYSAAAGFDRASVYCTDYAHLIDHIEARVSRVLEWRRAAEARAAA